MKTKHPLTDEQLIAWLCAGDVAIQFQVERDLLGNERKDLRGRITTEGWGAQFLQQRQPEGHWGKAFYNPKWISSHYTLLDLKHLNITPEHPLIRESIVQILHERKVKDGGINPAQSIVTSDVCINGMFLNYAAYFGTDAAALESIVDFLIAVQMPDGGFNCQSNRQGAVHSSLHTTISVLEGIHEYHVNGYTYRLDELQTIAHQCREFILQHKLFRSDHTGEIINPKFLVLSFPSRWYYDILRALEYFAAANISYDPRMQDALDVLLQKRRPDGTWSLQSPHPGQVHFVMEKAGQPSRWNTLRALRVFKIPSIMISLSTGNLIKANLASNVNVTMHLSGGSTAEDSYRWLMGEDATAFGEAIRDMWSPTCKSDPGKVTDAEYHCATTDGGGVHTNSGVPNHGYALLVDGGTYNGQTINAIGLVKAAHIYWRAQAFYQTPSSGFADHADALEASCNDLIGVPLEGLSTSSTPAGPSGQTITAADCTAVTAMTEAVELRTPPTQCNFQPLLQQNAPALCADTPYGATTVYLENFEAGLGTWTLTNQGAFSGWPGLDWTQATSLPGGRLGAAAFGADPDIGNCNLGSGDVSGVMRMESSNIVIPASSLTTPRLAFDHYVATEAGWDGGNLKISINGGVFSLVPASAFTFNPYNVTLNSAAAGNTNPLAGQAGFSGTDGGSVTGSWGQSQVNLAALGVAPGNTVRLRYDFGMDGCTGIDGWYVDDVHVYTCELAQPPSCAGAIASQSTLWPPNHHFRSINVVGVTDPNNDPLTITINSIFQDEAVNAPNSGNTAPDGQGVGSSTARVRAERVENGNGRVYHIAFTASDGVGGTCSGEVTVGVPVVKNGNVVDDGALYDSTQTP